MAEKIELHFGGPAPKISTQLKNAGVTASREKLELWQSWADAVTLLTIHGIMTPADKNRYRAKIAETVGQGVRRMTEDDLWR